MREFSIQENLKKLLGKLEKKDKKTYEILLRKMQEILTCENVEHYKNLRKPLQHLKRTHINNSFVLTFKYDKEKDHVLFYEFDHHDNIYCN
ncbi:addiction module toxin RelE [Candidatus Woesearchaeota archaeon CG10_big_fil_rev_8_21_14_0_10_37_12]|nr:MAG: addiction module toxin RelE [Candidatus Woesearchaeota archaeon CG10_big_fil_rev_8_21_14_0_10_37_12]